MKQRKWAGYIERGGGVMQRVRRGWGYIERGGRVMQREKGVGLCRESATSANWGSRPTQTAVSGSSSPPPRSSCLERTVQGPSSSSLSV